MSGEVALVTGGASGIGRGLCDVLGGRGAHVIVADLNAAGAEAVAKGIVASGGKAEAAALDVRDPAAFEATVDGIWRRLGKIDLFFNNAGIGGPFAEMKDVTLPEWRSVLDVNLNGVIHGIAAVYPRMVRQRSGHIVNTASGLGLIPAPMTGPYAASKFAVVGISLALRPEAKPHGVRVSVVCPGFIDTAIFEKSTTYKDLDFQRARTLFPKLLSATDCAVAILRGVERNRAIIPVTFLARLVWWINRLSPSLALFIAGRLIVDRVKALRALPAPKN
ncbi:MAG TPA: SDR family oxidoreductase [Myxococcaceae bacterium]|jgi:NAD(P)-dependent dehydrogenase (short-subunit alcohol dehydrogenase family)|nr:SDR family oxidoreductase [Myxococcaceae bacterium]